MDMLKKFFPVSFTDKPDVTSLVVALLIYMVVAIVTSVVFFLLSKIPFIGVLFAIIGGAVNFYLVAGVVLTILHFCKFLK